MAYTPENPKYKIYLSKNLKPLENVCDRGILMHEIIHVLQNDQKIFSEYDSKTKRHLREMDALVNHNIYLSQFGKKILYSNGFAARLKTNTKNNLYC
jgi:predicted metal-dependent peptidase